MEIIKILVMVLCLMHIRQYWEKFSDTVAMLQMPEFKDVFSLLYVLPTFFNSDLDRVFLLSIIT
jgi:hypothetical protein